MRPILLALLAGLALPASAQTVETAVDSLRSPVAMAAGKHTYAAQLLRRNSAGNLEAIPGQRKDVNLQLTASFVLVSFDGQKSTPMTVAGVRLLHAASGVGWTMPEHPINVTLPPLAVPAGQKVTCRYDMPIINGGKVLCSVGTAVPVVAAPQPAPTPPPPAPTGASPNGTRIPPATEIVDAQGAKWTPLAQTGGTAAQIGAARNGVRVSNSIDFLWVTDGVVFNQDLLSGSGCQRWGSGAWVTAACP